MPTRRLCALTAVLVVAGSLVLGAAAPAGAGDGDEGGGDRLADDSQVVVTGRLEVRSDERVETAVIFDGDAVIAGRVDGAVVAFNGDVHVSGHVEEDVVAFNGRAIIEDGATVEGDVLSSKRPRVAEGATVEGDARRVNFSAIFNSVGTAVWIFWWLAVTLSVLVAGLVLSGAFPRLVRRIVATGKADVGPSIGAGAAAGIVLPILSGLVLLTLVGIPLGVVGLSAMIPLYFFGYIMGCCFVGGLILDEKVNPLLVFLLGFVILRVVGIVPVIGGLVTFAAMLYGLGVFVVAAWRATRDRPAEPAAAAAS
jgi:hypothetical protein